MWTLGIGGGESSFHGKNDNREHAWAHEVDLAIFTPVRPESGKKGLVTSCTDAS